MTEILPAVETIERYVPQIVALDFDRTLCDVEAVMDRFNTIADYYGIDVAKITKAQWEIESKGGSFDPLGFILNSKLIDKKQINGFKNIFIELDLIPVVYKDAEKLLKELEENSVPSILITYAVNPIWQDMKIEASGYKGRRLILDHPEKGDEISRFRNLRGQYDITIPDGKRNVLYHADSVCLIDDKPQAFKALPADCEGFLINRKNHQGPLPENVRVINKLDQLEFISGKIQIKNSNNYK